MNREPLDGIDELVAILLESWAAVPGQESPVRLPGASLWRSPLDLQALHGAAAQTRASWLVVGEGIADDALVQVGLAFKRLMPSIRYALLGPPDDFERCDLWLRRGASVYCATTASAPRVVGALRASSSLGALVIDIQFQEADLFQRMQANAALPGGMVIPSERELEVLRLVEQGLSNAEIAAALSISENTVQTHMRHILRKLGVTSRAKAAERARRLGL